jgi:hypothetical protein
MLDYFRDLLSSVSNSGKIVGMQATTVAFDEDINGWTSRFSFIPQLGGSLRNNFYTFKSGGIWEHYSALVNKGTFYNITTNSSVSLVLNGSPSEVKNFNTINYEGTAGWELTSMLTDTDMAIPIQPFSQVYNLAAIENQLFLNNFKRKENKYFANIMNNSYVASGDVVYGQSMTGLKGFYATVTMEINNSVYGSAGSRSELFAVSTEYVNSSY